MKAIVIGGGIIGLSSAYYLKKRGWEVTVLDKTDLTDGCSYGNMGMIVPSHFVPLAAPGMLTQGIRWMFNNKSPFYIKPILNKELISWGWKFIKSANEKNVANASKALLDLHMYSKSLYEELASEQGFDFAFEKKGILMYYRSDKAGDEELHLAETAKKMGLDVCTLSKQQVQDLEPGCELNILGAVHYKCDAHLYPNKLVQQLIAGIVKSGVVIRPDTTVTNVISKKGRINELVTGNEIHQADIVVMACGSWLSQIAKMAGVKIPLMPGKGYSFTIDRPQKKLNIPAILCEARVAITPMNGHMRFGGTMEIGPVNNKINLNRVEGIVQAIGDYFPDMKLGLPDKKDIWYGFRPCSPDGLPYLGFAGKVENLIIAGGHAMMGLSLGPASGKIVADLASGMQPAVDITAFNVDRFS